MGQVQTGGHKEQMGVKKNEQIESRMVKGTDDMKLECQAVHS